jgi:hypothetical protein
MLETARWSDGSLAPTKKNFDFDDFKWSVNEKWEIVVNDNQKPYWEVVAEFKGNARCWTGSGSRINHSFLIFDGVAFDIDNFKLTEATPEEVCNVMQASKDLPLADTKGKILRK